MTADEVLAFARSLPPTVRRIEVPIYVQGPVSGMWDRLVVEQQPISAVLTVPEVGDVTKAADAKKAAAKRSDVDSLGEIGPVDMGLE